MVNQWTIGLRQVWGDEEISLEEIVKIRGTDLQDVWQSVKNHISSLSIKDGKPYKLRTPLGESSL
jgi:hypothetical protein